jgi:DEAD/DEAH box helicase domain-containing protein
LFEIHTDLLKAAFDMVSNCPCVDGCPACIGPSGEEETDTKQLTVVLLKALLGATE